MFSISVIIPVFNAENFIKKAIMSALSQKEVDEVLVIDDGSTDGTKDIVKAIVIKFPKVKFLAHENEINKGRSASRNLGIETAKSEFIAFLDADDFYLPNRFKKELELFSKYNDCGAVHNAVGFEVINPEFNHLSNQLYTVKELVHPDQLFLGLLDGLFGHFQINGFTIKKEVLDTAGFFNEALKVAEDTDFFWKVVLSTPTYTGVIDEPVAMRVVHDENCFYREELYENYDYMAYESVIKWAAQNGIEIYILDRILRRIWIIKHKANVGLWKEIKYWFLLTTLNHRLFFSKLNIKYFPIVRRRKAIFSFFYH